MKFCSKELKIRLQRLGEQEIADDPKVVAMIESTTKELTFYITEYNAQWDCYSGFLKSKEISDWCFLASNILDTLERTDTGSFIQDRTYTLLKDEPPISQLVPEIKTSIAMARYHREVEEKYEKEKNRGYELER